MKKLLPQTVQKRCIDLKYYYEEQIKKLKTEHNSQLLLIQERCPHKHTRSDDGWDKVCKDCGKYWTYRRS